MTYTRWCRTRVARLGLATDGHKHPFLLSGGMAQRVAFAATLAAGAPVLVVDEPTKGLDHALRDQMVALLKGVLQAGGALLVVTHDVAVPRALGGQVAVMRDTQVVEMNPAHKLLQAPAHPYTRSLLAAEPAGWPDAAPAEPRTAAPLIQAQGLTQRFGSRTLFENLNLELHAGERVAVTGPSGCGKTTLGNVLLGLVRPTSGTIDRAATLGPQALQKLYQDPLAAFAPRLTLRAALQDLMRLHRVPANALAALLERLALNPALLERLPAQVSGGELQRIALARMLLLRPALVFADEPTSRLDPITQQQTIALLTSTLAEQGSALLLVTHDPALARKASHRCIEVGRGWRAAS